MARLKRWLKGKGTATCLNCIQSPGTTGQTEATLQGVFWPAHECPAPPPTHKRVNVIKGTKSYDSSYNKGIVDTQW